MKPQSNIFLRYPFKLDKHSQTCVNDHLSTATTSNPSQSVLVLSLPLNNDHLSTMTSGHPNLVRSKRKNLSTSTTLVIFKIKNCHFFVKNIITLPKMLPILIKTTHILIKHSQQLFSRFLIKNILPFN